MGFTTVLGLAVLCVVNYGQTFEFSGLNPSVQSKTQVKPTFSLPTLKSFTTPTNQPQQATDPFKSVFNFKSAVTPKPFAAPFDPFKQPYQPYQPPASPFRANYQPFGPYPGYPGPVVYPGYQAPSAYPPPAFHGFNDPNQKPFGFQPFPAPTLAPTQAPLNSFKFGGPKKFNKNSQGFPEFNLPGKYFQEHQFGAYHGPEFSSAIVPAEHNIKQSKPKDTLLGKPVVPALPEFGLTKQVFGGFAPPQSFAYPVPSFPQFQSLVSTVPPTQQAQDESATARVAADEQQSFLQSTTPAAPSSSETYTAADVAVTSSEQPAAEAVQQNEPSSSAPAVEDVTTAQPFSPVVVESVRDASTQAAAPEVVTGKSEVDQSTGSPAAVNLPGLPNQFYGQAAPSPSSDPSSLAGIFSTTGLPFFEQSAGAQQSSFASFYDAPKFTDEELKLFAATFGSTGLQASQIFGTADPAVKITEGAISTENSIPASSTPSAEKVEINENFANAVKTESVANSEAGEKIESGEKKESGESRNIPDGPKKSNTVQIVQDDVFNGQFPLLYDPSNSASPLDTYRFYNLPSVSALSSQATLAAYSPESAFTNFGTQFNQGYLVEGSPSLTPVTKTVIQTSQTPISIASADHPLHSQIFKFSQSFVPYPQVAAANSAGAIRSFEVPSSSTPLPLVQASNAVPATSAESVVVKSKTAQ